MCVCVYSVPVFIMLYKLVLNVTCTNCHNKRTAATNNTIN